MSGINKLLDGFRDFQKEYFGEDKTLFEKLKKSQKPKTMVIGCSDSRVDPSILTKCEPGDIFIVRNVANLVPPYDPDHGHHGVSSAIEYAVLVLKVEHIVVMGHSHCGGIDGLMYDEGIYAEFEFVKDWVNIAKEAKDYVLEHYKDSPKGEQHRACEQASVVLSLNNLMSFPFIKKAVEAGTLKLHGWYFDIVTGKLLEYSDDKKDFIAIV